MIQFHLMEMPNEPTLLSLPAELRIQILELIVYHYETGGIISPIPDNIDTTFIVFASGERITMTDEQIPCVSSSPRFNDLRPPLERRQRLAQVWENSPNAASGHFCTLDCLVQPAIARTSKLLRHETLPIFYGKNHIHLELGNFTLPLGPWEPKVKRAPCDWWRASGNSISGYVKNISIAGELLPSERRHEGVMVTYTHRPRHAWVTSHFEEKYRYKDDGFAKARQPVIDASIAAVQPALDVLAEEGPHVRVIEEIVEWMERGKGLYLRRGKAMRAEMTIVAQEVSGPRHRGRK